MIKRVLEVPVQGLLGLGVAGVGYAVAGVLLTIVLLAILAVPLVVAFRQHAPRRLQQLGQQIRPLW
jgi:hypothetical protein